MATGLFTPFSNTAPSPKTRPATPAYSNNPPGQAIVPFDVRFAVSGDLGDIIPGATFDGVVAKTGDRALRFGTVDDTDGIVVVGAPGNPATPAPETATSDVMPRYVRVLEGETMGGKVFEASMYDPPNYGFTEMATTPKLVKGGRYSKVPPHASAGV